MNSHQVGVAAEAIAAGVLAQAGYDVLVQYGANQPGYDLVAIKNQRLLKISVKGTQKDGWGLTQSYKEGHTYHEAVDVWFDRQPQDVILSLVDFTNAPLGTMPTIYLARPSEIAQHLKAVAQGLGDTTLRVKKTWKGGIHEGHTDQIPDAWKFTQQRIDAI